ASENIVPCGPEGGGELGGKLGGIDGGLGGRAAALEQGEEEARAGQEWADIVFQCHGAFEGTWLRRDRLFRECLFLSGFADQVVGGGGEPRGQFAEQKNLSGLLAQDAEHAFGENGGVVFPGHLSVRTSWNRACRLR